MLSKERLKTPGLSAGFSFLPFTTQSTILIIDKHQAKGNTFTPHASPQTPINQQHLQK
ncbi:hypothetical protein H6S22_10020 [Escherichia coli]|nr:hypothetical protein H6S22_10020 [Escherichia coli]